MCLLPPRSMVGQLPLEQPIGVRIPGGQPKPHFPRTSSNSAVTPRSIKCRLKTKSLNLLLSLASYQGASSLAPQSAHPSSKKRRPQQNRAPKRMRGPHSLILRSPHQEQRSPQTRLAGTYIPNGANLSLPPLFESLIFTFLGAQS